MPADVGGAEAGDAPVHCSECSGSVAGEIGDPGEGGTGGVTENPGESGAAESGGDVESADRGDGPGSPFRLRSSSLFLNGATWQATADGDVHLAYEGTTLDADEVFLDIEKKESFARGSVRLMHGEDLLTCDTLSFQWETQVGTVENGDLFVQTTGYRIRSEFMEKTGPDTYTSEQSSFTTCRCPEGCSRLPWLVQAEDAEVTLGGYAKISKARFRLFGIPILYFPIAYLPIKLTRESGLLFPQISQSGINGWGFGIPYFWAINASQDATFLLEGYTKRGAKPNAEFRYRPSTRTDGTWNASAFYDMQEEMGRYGIKGRHFQDLSDSFYDKLYLNVVSDGNYIEDFPWELGWTADRLLESDGAFGYRRDNFHAAAVTYYSQLVDGVGGQEIAQKAPEISARLFQRPVLWPWLSVSLDSTGTNYVNENAEERVRGQVVPEAELFFQPLPGLTVRGYGGVREVLSWGGMELYNLPGADQPGFATQQVRHRTLAESGAEVSARVGRAFQWGSQRLFHIIQPGLEYQWIQKVEGEPFPVEMDGLDVLERRNWLTYSLRTSLWGANTATGAPGRLLGEIRVVQSLALDQDVQAFPGPRLFSDVRLSILLNPRPYLSCKLDVQVDPQDPALRWLEGDVSVWDRKKNYGLSLGYIEHDAYEVSPLTRVELVDVYDQDFLFPGIGDTVRAGVTARPFPWLTAVWNTLFLLNESGKVENHVSIEYLSQCKCWSVILRLRQTVRPDDFGFSVQVRLDGLGSY
jgi:LPS-assembly protein